MFSNKTEGISIKSYSPTISCIYATLLFALKFFLSALRPILGGRGICIYQEKSCQAYVLKTIKEKTLPYALILIAYRLISCNPINGLIRFYNQR